MTTAFDVDLTGKVAVVTGATSGIGTEIARGLARLGASLVITARDPGRGEEARADLAPYAPDRNAVAVLPLDVADIRSVRAFAASLGKLHDRLDILVNNAGTWYTDRRESPDGIELVFATNVLGPYLLTELLTDRMRESGQARVINIGSSIANNYDATDLQFTTRKYQGFQAYAQSKQAIRMITWGQADRLASAGITANVVAPGFVRTGLNRNARGFTVRMINLSARMFAVSPAKGADGPLWAAAAPELRGVTGKYFDGRKERDGGPRDMTAVADLEHRCNEMISGAAAEA